MSSTARMRGADPQEEARSIIADADRLIRNEEAKLDAVRRKRAELDDQFQVKARERAEAIEASRRLEAERMCAELVAADAEVLAAVDEAEDHFKAYVAAINPTESQGRK